MTSFGGEGHLLLKLKVGNDLRALSIVNEDLNYGDLALMVQRLFPGKVSQTDDLLFKYRDEDGDLINVIDDNDLAFAKVYTKGKLRLTVYVKRDGEYVEPGAMSVETLRNELSMLVERVTSLIPLLDNAGVSRGDMANGAMSTDDATKPQARPKAKVDVSEFEPRPTGGSASLAATEIDQLAEAYGSGSGSAAPSSSQPQYEAEPSAPPSFSAPAPPTQAPYGSATQYMSSGPSSSAGGYPSHPGALGRTSTAPAYDGAPLTDASNTTPTMGPPSHPPTSTPPMSSVPSSSYPPAPSASSPYGSMSMPPSSDSMQQQHQQSSSGAYQQQQRPPVGTPPMSSSTNTLSSPSFTQYHQQQQQPGAYPGSAPPQPPQGTPPTVQQQQQFRPGMAPPTQTSPAPPGYGQQPQQYGMPTPPMGAPPTGYFTPGQVSGPPPAGNYGYGAAPPPPQQQYRY